MRPTKPLLLPAAVCVFALFVAPARAQTADPEPSPPPIYPQLFPAPSGQNGYEEIAAAIDALPAADVQAAHSRGATLERRRSLLANPTVVRARGLLRQGLAKPVVSPRAGKELTFATLFPDLAGVRNLARMLAVEIYVAFADGKTGAGLSAMNDGLRLGRIVKSEALIGSLVGLATDTMLLEAVARHREQWSVDDCVRILASVQWFANAPDPIIDALEAERRVLVTEVRRLLEAAVQEADVAREFASTDPEDTTAAELTEAARRWRVAPTDVRQAASSRAMSRVNLEFDALITRVRDPLAKTPAAPPSSEAAAGRSDMASRLVDLLLPVSHGVAVRTGENRTRLCLLAIHAALRRHRWEHGVLPATLEELKLPRFTTDPLTGKPLSYKRVSDTEYELSGAPASGGSGPILLPRLPKP